MTSCPRSRAWSPTSASAETHGSALELASRPHATAAAAAAELARLRAGLADDLAPLGLRAAAAGTHPFAQWSEVEVSEGARYQSIYETMRELARREPTFALHVHVAVPDADAAVRALRGMRVHVPLLLALAANSPFWQGRDTGLAAARVPVFGSFPRVGIPRAFASYGEYVEAVDILLRCDAFPEPTFLWWDVRLQPRFGTLEVRIMDAQTRTADNAALAALVQCAVRLEATEGFGFGCTSGGARREPVPRDARRDAGRPDRRPDRDPAAGARDPGRAPRRLRTACRRAGLRGRARDGRRAGRRYRRPPPAAARGRRAKATPWGPRSGCSCPRSPTTSPPGAPSRRCSPDPGSPRRRWLAWPRGQRVSATARRASISCGLRA